MSDDMSTTLSRTRRLLQAAAVIARRDYVATVWSRSFIMFLLTPIIAIGFGGVIGSIGGKVDEAALKPVVAIIATAEAMPAFRAAQQRLASRNDSFPSLRLELPAGAADRQARTLLSDAVRAPSVVLTGWPTALRLHGPTSQLEARAPDVEALAEEAALELQLTKSGQKRPTIALTLWDRAPGAEGGAVAVFRAGAPRPYEVMSAWRGVVSG